MTAAKKLRVKEFSGKAISVVGALLLFATAAQAGDFRVGVGIGMLGNEGKDVQVEFRPGDTHWRAGWRYTQWRDDFYDPFISGRLLTRTWETHNGPTLNYVFRPENPGSWYLGVEVLDWSKTEQAMANMVKSTDGNVDPYFGGGYSRRFAKYFFWNFGMHIAPSASMTTNTGMSSTEDQGGFDVEMILGFAR